MSAKAQHKIENDRNRRTKRHTTTSALRLTLLIRRLFEQAAVLGRRLKLMLG